MMLVRQNVLTTIMLKNVRLSYKNVKLHLETLRIHPETKFHSELSFCTNLTQVYFL